MRFLFIAVHLSLLVYFVRRRFDLITVAFYASSAYFLPGYFGYVCYDARDLQLDPISLELYVFYISFYLLLFVCAVCGTPAECSARWGSQTYQQADDRPDPRLSTALVILRFIVPALLLLGEYLTVGGLWREDKQELLDSLSWAYVAFQNATYVYLVVSAVRKSKGDLALAISYCCVDLVVGFRSTAAFALFSLMTIGLMRRPTNLLRNSLVPMVIVAAFLFGSTYKTLILRYLIDGLPAVADYLSDPASLLESLYQNEAFSQQHIFNRIVETNFQLPVDYPLNMARLFFPGAANVMFGTGMSFNDYFQPSLYPDVPWGMASNIWAEQFAVGGAVGLYAFLLAYGVGLTFANGTSIRFLLAGKDTQFIILSGMAVPALLYMHRNDLLYELVLVRNLGFLVLAIWLVVSIRWRVRVPHGRSVNFG